MLVFPWFGLTPGSPRAPSQICPFGQASASGLGHSGADSKALSDQDVGQFRTDQDLGLLS